VNLLDKWDSFYVIVGSASGALIGLQFVVLTLIAERPPPDAARAGAAFSTPTIVHFSVVLGLAAMVRMPWTGTMPIALAFGIIGLAGMIYSLVVVWFIRAQDAYAPDWEDWLFHVALPLVAYLTLAGSAWLGLANLRVALFTIGGAVLLLLFAGIHNAWDAISFHVLQKAPKKPDKRG
jgi:hypothetical protein